MIFLKKILSIFFIKDNILSNVGIAVVSTIVGKFYL